MAELAEALPDSNGDAIRGLNILLRKLEVKTSLGILAFKKLTLSFQTPHWNPKPIEKDLIQEVTEYSKMLGW